MVPAARVRYRIESQSVMTLPARDWRRDDIPHAPDNPHANLIEQSVVFQAGLADDQTNSLRFHRLQDVEDRRTLHHHLDSGGVETDGARQRLVLHQEQQVLSQQRVLQFDIAGPHAVMNDLDEY